MPLAAMALVVSTVCSVGLEATSESPYGAVPLSDGIATGLLLGLLAVNEGIVKRTLKGGLACKPRAGTERCDPATLNALDRTVVGNRSRTWALVSDAGFFGATAAAVAVAGWDVWRSGALQPWKDFGRDVFVITESVVLATAVTHVLKLATRRPRPTQYDESRGIGSVEHQLSFPSGHTSSTAAVATACTTTYALRHPNSPWRFVVAAAAVVVTALTGYGRVGAGMHFYSDVIAAAMLGGGLGVLVPTWHRRNRIEGSTAGIGALSVSATQPWLSGGTAVQLSLTF